MDSDEDVGMRADEATKPSFLGSGKGKAVDKPRNNYDDDNLPWCVVRRSVAIESLTDSARFRGWKSTDL